MKKRLFTLICVLCLIIALPVVFGACKSHEHTWADAWTSDDTYHWHAATCKHTDEVGDKAEHTWNEGEITTPATETAEGVLTKTCTVCGKTKTSSIPATGVPAHTHSYTSAVTAPTCTEKGYTTHTCACGESYVDTYVDEIGHNYATLTANNDGTHTATCANCNGSKAEACVYTPAVTAPTCTEQGYTTYTCACNHSYRDEYEAATDHSYKEEFSHNDSYHWRDATCSHTTERADYQPHNYTSVVVTKPTCTEGGYTTYTCDCGYSYQGDLVDATGHSVSNWIKTDTALIDPTCCQYAITYEGECTVCSEVDHKTETITQHSYYWAITTPATCQKGGEKTQLCNNVDCVDHVAHENSQKLPYEDPDAHEWVIDTEASTETLTAYKCSHNGCRETKKTVTADNDSVELNGSDLNDFNEVEFPEATLGFDQGVKDNLAQNGNVSISASTLKDEAKEDAIKKAQLSDEDLLLLGDNPIYSFTVTGDEEISELGGKATVRIKYKLEPGQNPDEIVVWYISKGELVAVPATYALDENGEGYITFTTEHFSFYAPAQLSAVQYCLAFGHSKTNVRTVAPTCTTGGYTICLHCGQVIDFTMPTGHNWHTSVAVETSCSANGKMHFACEDCDAAYDTVIPAIGHYYVLHDHKSATCQEAGGNTFRCAWCGDEYTLTIPQLRHNHTVRTVAPTCTSAGYTEKTCTACGDTLITNYLAPLGHIYNNTWSTAEEGHYHICTVCGERDELHAHTPGAAATEQSAQICTVCEYVITPPIVHVHKLTAVEAKAHDCTHNGNIAYYTCECGKWFLDANAQQLITDHTAVIVLAKGHTPEGIDPVTPTCTEIGYTAGIKCATCGTLLSGHVQINATGHSYKAVVTVATCTEGGYTVYTCACGDTYTDDVTEPLGHNEIATVKAPTCTEGGYTTYTCTRCDAAPRVENHTSELGHKLSDNLTYDENHHWRTCLRCSEALNKEAHTPDHAEATTEHGVTCTACGYVIEEILEHVHSVSRAVSGREPTCTASGLKPYYICACGTWFEDEACTKAIISTASVVIPAKGHTLQTVPATESTCTQNGYSEGKFCTVCQRWVSGHVELPLLDHVYEAVVTAPTCTEKGYTTYTCHCGDTYVDDYVDALGHSYNAVVTAPTCTEKGYTTYTCHCGDSYVDDYIDALGHSHNAVVTAPTCTEKGFTTYTCHCGDSYVDDEVKALGHDESAVVTAPTCTKEGYTTYTCTRCDATRRGDVVGATGHSYKAVVTKPTCTSQGFTTYTCHCGDSYVDDYVDMSEHSYQGTVTKPTCTEKGYTSYSCTVCGDAYVGDEVDALGHSHQAVVTEPTCTASGFTTYTCHCGDSYVDSFVDALGHNFVDGSCTRCGEKDGDVEEKEVVYVYDVYEKFDDFGALKGHFEFYSDYTAYLYAALYDPDGSLVESNDMWATWALEKDLVVLRMDFEDEVEYVHFTVNEDGFTLSEYNGSEEDQEMSYIFVEKEEDTWQLTYKFYSDKTVYAIEGYYDENGEFVVEFEAWAEWIQKEDGKIAIVYEGEEVALFTVSDDGFTLVLYECPHENTEKHETPATCTQGGHGYVICLDCGRQLEGFGTSPLGHDFVDGVCTRCGEKDGDVTDKKIVYFFGASEMGIDVRYEFYDDGTVCVFVAFQEGDEYQEESVWGNWKSDGKYVYFYFEGEEVIRFLISEDGYNLIPDEGENECLHEKIDTDFEEPTCTTHGYNVTYCNDCGETLEESFTEPLGHSFVEGVCERCGRYEKEVANKNILYVYNEFEGDDWAFVYEFNDDGSIYAKELYYAKDGTVVVLYDDWAEWIYKEDNRIAIVYDGEEVETFIISEDGKTLIPYECPHENTINVIDRMPTCTEWGEEHVECLDCGAHLEWFSRAPLGHNFVDGVCTNCGEKDGQTDEKKALYVFDLKEDGAILHVDFYADFTALYTITAAMDGANPETFTLWGTWDYVKENGQIVLSIEFGEFYFVINDDNYTLTLVEDDEEECLHENVDTDEEEPGCTTHGYRVTYCEDCDDTLEEIFFEPHGHSFTDGICENCGMDEKIVGGEKEIQYVYSEEDEDFRWGMIYEFNTDNTLYAKELYYAKDGTVVVLYDDWAEWIYKEDNRIAIVYDGEEVEIFIISEDGKTLILYECPHENTINVIDRMPTCTEWGEEHVECLDCGAHLEWFSREPLGHNFVNGTCDRCGVTEGFGPIEPVKFIRYTFEEITETSKLFIYFYNDYTARINMEYRNSADSNEWYGNEIHTSWNWENDTVVLNFEALSGMRFTVNEDGKTLSLFVAEECKHENTEVIITDPTCTTFGHYHEYCYNCNKVVKEEYSKLLGHDFDEKGNCLRCGQNAKELDSKQILYVFDYGDSDYGILFEFYSDNTIYGMEKRNVAGYGWIVLSDQWAEWIEMEDGRIVIIDEDEVMMSFVVSDDGKTLILYQCPHEHTANTIVSLPTCTDWGEERVDCLDCGETIEWHSIEPFGHNFIDGTCDRCGETEGFGPIVPAKKLLYTFSEKGDGYHVYHEYYSDFTVLGKMEEVDENGYVHTEEMWAEWKYDGEYILVVYEGEVTLRLTVNPDGKTLSLVENDQPEYPSCKHEITYQTASPSTCTTGGSVTTYCKECGEILDHYYTPAPGHDFDEQGVCRRCGEYGGEIEREIRYLFEQNGEGMAYLRFEFYVDHVVYGCGEYVNGDEVQVVEEWAEWGYENGYIVVIEDGKSVAYFTVNEDDYTLTMVENPYPEQPNDCEHKNALTTTREPTCTEDGFVSTTCGDCKTGWGHSIPALGHEFDSDDLCVRCGEKHGGEELWVKLEEMLIDLDEIWNYYLYEMQAKLLPNFDYYEKTYYDVRQKLEMASTFEDLARLEGRMALIFDEMERLLEEMGGSDPEKKIAYYYEQSITPPFIHIEFYDDGSLQARITEITADGFYVENYFYGTWYQPSANKLCADFNGQRITFTLLPDRTLIPEGNAGEENLDRIIEGILKKMNSMWSEFYQFEHFDVVLMAYPEYQHNYERMQNDVQNASSVEEVDIIFAEFERMVNEIRRLLNDLQAQLDEIKRNVKRMETEWSAYCTLLDMYSEPYYEFVHRYENLRAELDMVTALEDCNRIFQEFQMLEEEINAKANENGTSFFESLYETVRYHMKDTYAGYTSDKAYVSHPQYEEFSSRYQELYSLCKNASCFEEYFYAYTEFNALIEEIEDAMANVCMHSNWYVESLKEGNCTVNGTETRRCYDCDYTWTIIKHAKGHEFIGDFCQNCGERIDEQLKFFRDEMDAYWTVYEMFRPEQEQFHAGIVADFNNIRDRVLHAKSVGEAANAYNFDFGNLKMQMSQELTYLAEGDYAALGNEIGTAFSKDWNKVTSDPTFAELELYEEYSAMHRDLSSRLRKVSDYTEILEIAKEYYQLIKMVDAELNCPHNEFFVAEELLPSCTYDGCITYRCTECGIERKEVLPAIGHIFMDDFCQNCGISAFDLHKQEMRSHFAQLWNTYMSETELTKLPDYPYFRTQRTEIRSKLDMAMTEEELADAIAAFERFFKELDRALEAYANGEDFCPHPNAVVQDRMEPTCTTEGYEMIYCPDCDTTERISLDRVDHSFGEDGSCIYCGCEEIANFQHELLSRVEETWAAYLSETALANLESYVWFEKSYKNIRNNVKRATTFDELSALEMEFNELICQIEDALAEFGGYEPVCPHVNREMLVQEPASCTSLGKGVYVCVDCGMETEHVVLPLLPHEYDPAGICVNCGRSGITEDVEEYRKELLKNIEITWQYYLSERNIKALKEYPEFNVRRVEIRAAIMNASFRDQLDAAAADFDKLIFDVETALENQGGIGTCEHPNISAGFRQEPDCTSPGFEEYFCPDCGYGFRTYIEPTGHVYDELGRCMNCGDCQHLSFSSTEIAPTCTENGVLQTICDACGYVNEITIPASGHDYDEKDFCRHCYLPRPATLYVFTSTQNNIAIRYEFYSDGTIRGEAKEFDEAGNVMMEMEAWAKWVEENGEIVLLVNGEEEERFAVAEDGTTLILVEKEPEKPEVEYEYHAVENDVLCEFYFYSDGTARLHLYVWEEVASAWRPEYTELSSWYIDPVTFRLHTFLQNVERIFDIGAAHELIPSMPDAPDLPELPDPGITPDDPDIGGGTIAPVIPDVGGDSNENVDFEGEEVVILVPAAVSGNWDMMDPDDMGDRINAEVFERNRYLEEKLNVSLTFATITPQEYSTRVQNAVLAGTNEYDFVSYQANAVTPLANQGLYADLRDADGLDLDAEWWNSNYNRSAGMLGKQYTAVGDITLSVYDQLSVVFYNRDLMNAFFGEEEIFNLVVSGEWTMERMQEYVEIAYSDLNCNAMIDTEDRLGLLGLTGNCSAIGFAQVGGFSFVTYDENNGSVSLSASMGMMDLMDRLVNLWETMGTYQASPNEMYQLMANGETLFMTDMLNRRANTTVGTTQVMKESGISFGVLPLPKYSEEQECYTAGVNGTHNVIAVPGEQVSAKTEAVLNLMGEYNHKNLVRAYQDSVCGWMVDSEQAQLLLEVAMNSAAWDFVAVYDGAIGRPQSVIWLNAFRNGRPLVTEFQMNEAMINARLYELVGSLQN